MTQFRTWVLACGLVLALQPLHGWKFQGPAAQRDGQHDFDWDIGTWKAHMRRLLHPLTGSATWVEYDGTDVVRKIWDGRANLGEVEADGPSGHLELLTLRLYNPQAHQWTINIANSAAGTVSVPAVGEFKNGVGEFIDQESFNSRTILVRFGISDITPSSARFDQAFSADGGKTWEVNLIVTETLVNDADGSDKTHRTQPVRDTQPAECVLAPHAESDVSRQ
jgi:hypothetical protein